MATNPRRASTTRTKSVNEVEIVPISQVDIDNFLEKPSSVIEFPSDLTDQEMVYGVRAGYVLNEINADSTPSSFKRFDTTMKCKVCGVAGHSFDACPVVQNVPFVKNAYIKTCLFLRAMEKAQSLLSVDVAEVDSDAYHTAHDAASSNESTSEDSAPEDFCQGD